MFNLITTRMDFMASVIIIMFAIALMIGLIALLCLLLDSIIETRWLFIAAVLFACIAVVSIIIAWGFYIYALTSL